MIDRIWVNFNQDISILSIHQFYQSHFLKTCFLYNFDILHTNLIEMKRWDYHTWQACHFSKHINLSNSLCIYLHNGFPSQSTHNISWDNEISYNYTLDERWDKMRDEIRDRYDKRWDKMVNEIWWYMIS